MMGLDVEEDPHPKAKEFFDMLRAAEKPLYNGSELSFLLMATRIMDLKCKYNVSSRGMDDLASFVKDICSDNDKIKVTEVFDATEKLFAGLELPHEKIDVCPNGCMLFWKGDAFLEKCSSCKTDRYKTNSKDKPVAKKVLIYFPITPRLQRLYATKSIAGHMRWHSENTRVDGSMVHPCHGEAWKKFNSMYTKFSVEARNVRLGLCINEFSSFGKYGKPCSCWPVILTPYNLPPWKCMERPFMFLSLIIPGPDSPKGNLDVYLQPLVEELKHLWDIGVLTYDVSKKQNFNMKAALMWTITDSPTYGMLYGQSTTDALVCPYCMESMKPLTFEHGCKQIMRDQLCNRVSSLPKATYNWPKSILWKLPYWGKLLIRHNLDIIDIEKNVCDQLIHTIMDIKDEAKDDVSARREVVLRCKRRKQHHPAIDVAGGTGDPMPLPIAPYLLNKEQRKVLCEWIQELKFPGGYASNLRRCVDLHEYKLFGMNNHDCHVFLERLLPVALRELLPANVWAVLTELSQFFRDTSSSLLRTEDMVYLQDSILDILCKLENVFPSAFFDTMNHLPIHLPYEALVGGPVQYRWLYPFQRFLHHFKRKVDHKSSIGSSICNAYLAEEMSIFCAHWSEPHIYTETPNMGPNVGRGVQKLMDPKTLEPFSFTVGDATTNGVTRQLDEKDYRVAHECVLANCELLRQYEMVFEREIIRRHPRVNVNDVWSNFEHQFIDWFKQYVLSSDHISDDIIRTLAMGPSRVVRVLDHCHINGCNFDTYAYGKNKSTMNYGVCAKLFNGSEYYGILQEIIELVYHGAITCYRTILFKCDWMDSGMGINVHEKYKLVEVNHTMKLPRYDPFVLANGVQQVYFTAHPSTKNDRDHWWAVFKIKKRSIIDVVADYEAFQEEVDENPLSLPQVEEDEEDDDDQEEED